MKTRVLSLTTFMLLAVAIPVMPVIACSLEAWDGATVGAFAGDPTNDIARVGGRCALRVTAKGQVFDSSPEDETEFIGRFYFYPEMLGPGSHVIFAALSDQTKINSRVFVITYDGSHIRLDASASGGGKASAVADPTHWNLVEFSWRKGKPGKLWVNKDASSTPASDTFPSGTGSIDQVRMGALSGIGAKKAFFDDYVSKRSSAVGPLTLGDGNSDGVVNAADIDVIVNEYLHDDLGNGVVDCNLDAAVNSGDVNCVASEL